MKKVIGFFILFACFVKTQGQNEKNWQLNGYVSALGSFKTEKLDSVKNSYKDLVINNRFNFEYYPVQNTTFYVSVRNRLIYNESYKNIPGIEKQFERDQGWIQLAKNIFYRNNYILNTSVDRFYFQFTKDKLEIDVGRQRINWSQSFAWNPNDIFNASNYFDFDYPEKPGSDAIRMQYYTGMASSAELVVKIDHLKKITTAGLFKANIKSYDVQFLSGILNEEEFVLGSGWSGNISDIGFRGEITTLLPFKDTSLYMHSMNNLVMADLSFDYTFSNSASIMCEALYSNNSIEAMSASLTSIFSSPVTVRNLSFSRLSALFSFTYPLHPLINVSLSGMYFYRITGYYAGPNLDFSVTDNLNLSLYWQYFYMFLSKENLIRMGDISVNYLFLRLKYNF